MIQRTCLRARLMVIVVISCSSSLMAEDKKKFDVDAAAKEVNELAQVESLPTVERERRLSKLEALGNQIESAREAVDAEVYAGLMLQLARTVGSVDFGDKRRIYLAQKYAMAGLGVSDRISIELECSLLTYARGNTGPDGKFLSENSWTLRRKEHARAFLHAWRRMRNSIDEKWHPKDTGYRNISPPPETGLPSGVAPEAIKDDVQRAKYEAELLVNKNKLQRNREQITIRRLQENWLPEAQRYLIFSYSEPPQATDEINKLMEEYGIAAEVRAKIAEAIKKKLPPREWPSDKVARTAPTSTRPSEKK